MNAVSVENKRDDIEAAPKPKRDPLPKRLFTLEEMAPYLGQKDHWGVRHLINFEGLKTVRYGKRGIRIDIRDADDWIEKHKDVVSF